MDYDNRALIIPDYTDDEASGVDVPAFPFNSPNMKYSKLTHMYSLTPEALRSNGIVVDTQEIPNFIKQVTSSIYSYITAKAGKTNYSIMQYRIAKGWAKHMSPLSMRANFLELMLTQARYMNTLGYAKDTPKTTVTETGRTKAVDLSQIDGYWLHDDVITTLDALNLTNSQYVKKGSWGYGAGYNVDYTQY
jgi:hypothetical protein